MSNEEQDTGRYAPSSDEATLDDAPRIERYELLHILARGGMGAVYRARDRKTGELRAVKCVRVGQHEHPTLLMEGLQREFQVLRSLSHPRIIRVFDYGLLSDGAYYSMELLEGEDLRTGGPFHWRETCQYMHDIATCLSLLHARRLIHRDLSAGNVKRTGDGHCKLIDFGALTGFGRTDTLIGTAPFIAPEVLEVGRLDQRVDLYALGALAYYCIAGHHAYPASSVDELPDAWRNMPAVLEDFQPDVPAALSGLIMDLLRDDPLARPASAAEVIARLESIAELSTEDAASRRVLAQSFLAAPGFVGRRGELQHLERAIDGARDGVGGAMRIVAPSGAGRTRMLDEIAVRAQLAGATVLRADSSVAVGRYGTARALCSALLEEVPAGAARAARDHKSAIAGLSDPAIQLALQRGPRSPSSDRPDAVARPSARASRREWAVSTRRNLRVSSRPARVPTNLEQWFVDVSRERPLVVLVDNVDTADDASLGFLLGLSRASLHQRLLVVCTELPEMSRQVSFGMQALRLACEELPLSPLRLEEAYELMRTVFGDAPRLERLADWIHAESAGSPLHCIDILRDLIARDEIRHEHGAWLLPARRPDTHTSEQLEDVLTRRLLRLSPQSRELVQCLCLHRLDPTLELCRLLSSDAGEQGVVPLLDELAINDILFWAEGHFAFSSAALRQATLRRLDTRSQRSSHLRLGRALMQLAEDDDLALQLEAGYHLIKGGEETVGADMIARVCQNTFACNVLVANLHQIGATVEAALKVYMRSRRSRRARLPLLTVLAQAGYYEHYRWADAYGDDALDIVEDLSGFGMARNLRKYLGRYLSLMVGMAFACVRHYSAPRGVRGGSFIHLLVHVCSMITSLAGVAAISLDRDRSKRVCSVLSPVAWLPERLALVGIYRFCVGIGEIAREHPVEAYAQFADMAEKLERPGYYWFLPEDARMVYIAASNFARGAFAMMRADSGAAFDSADKLDATGLPLYQMIAAQIRRLTHLNRGEFAMAQLQAERVEIHAARAGSAWQVELWEPASLLPLCMITSDAVEMARLARRLGRIVEDVPSMWTYRELAELVTSVYATNVESWSGEEIDLATKRLEEHLSRELPRDFIGWSATLGGIAVAFNRRGEYGLALEYCQRALAHMTDADREYTMLFLIVDVQAAVAEAGLSRPGAAMERLDGLIERYTPSMNALVLGTLHEARARIALAAGRRADFADSTNEAARWLRGTGTPSLVAIADRLAALTLKRSARPIEIVEREVTVVERLPPAKDSPGQS